MGIFGKKEKVDTDKVSVNEELTGKADPVFAHLLAESLRGAINIYSAIIPTNLIKLYDEAPTKHPQFKTLLGHFIEQLAEAAEMNRTPPVFVYFSNGNYIVSDDYFLLEAYKELQRMEVPCWVLGMPDERAKDIKGPVSQDQVKLVLGVGE